MASSSSSLSDRPLSDWIEEALATLLSENPHGYRRICAALGRSGLDLEVDGEMVRVQSDGREIHLTSSPSGYARISCSRATLLSLLDGDRSIGMAARSGALEVRGCPAELLRLSDGLRVALHAAIRAPSFGDLLDRYRSGSTDEPRGDSNG
jgi:hypothetical protein